MTEQYIRSENLKKAQYRKHHIYEVAKTSTEAKYIANDLANAKRYAYRARVVLLGEASVRPYDPIYLDGLPNGLSGYWTVLSVKHQFNTQSLKYKMELEVGTDKLGDVNPNASKAVQSRNVEAELAGQSLEPVQSMLIDIQGSVNSSSLVNTYGATTPTPTVAPAANAVPTSISADPYSYDAPTPTKDISSTKWVAM